MTAVGSPAAKVEAGGRVLPEAFSPSVSLNLLGQKVVCLFVCFSFFNCLFEILKKEKKKHTRRRAGGTERLPAKQPSPWFCRGLEAFSHPWWCFLDKQRMLAIGAGGFRRRVCAGQGRGEPGLAVPGQPGRVWMRRKAGWAREGGVGAEAASWHGRRRVVPRHLENTSRRSGLGAGGQGHRVSGSQ